MTHSFAQATLEIGGPGNKNKNSACRAASSTARNPRVANHSPTPTPVGYDLGGSRDSLLVGRCQPNQKSGNHIDPVDRLLEEARLLLVPWRSAGGGPMGGAGSLGLWPSRQPGSTDDARHHTIANLPTHGQEGWARYLPLGS